MSNYGTMTTRILNELDRDDITAEVQTAIQTAIKYYASHRFFFNEERWLASTTASQEYYPLPNNFKEIDTIRLTASDNNYLLHRRHWDEMEELAVDASTYEGYPTDYTIFRNELRLYPVPNASYKMQLSGQKDLAGLSADSTTNDWMTTAEELIRSRAAADVLENILQDYDGPRVTLYKTRERDTFRNLKDESYSRVATGRSRKRRW